MSDEKKNGQPVAEAGDASAEQPVLTNRQGHPVYDNQNTRTVGERGPTVLENYQFLEKITHFDRERIPERVVHARGAGAHGYFEAYGRIGSDPASKYTRAKLFQEQGKRTPVFVRFSTLFRSCCMDRLRDWSIRLSNDGSTWTEVFRDARPEGAGLLTTFNENLPIFSGSNAGRTSTSSTWTARFVRVQINRPATWLSLAEVQVWGP